MNLETLGGVFQNIGIIIAGLTAIIGSIGATFKVFIPFYKTSKRLVENIERIDSELKTNGGSSLRDAVNRSEKVLSDLSQKTDVLHTEILSINARQWALVATQRDPVFETDRDGSVLRVNAVFSNLVERDLESIKGNGWENFIDPDQRDRVIREWETAIEKLRAFEYDFTVIGHITNTRYNVKCIANPYYDHEGDIIGYIGRYIEVAKVK